MGINLRARIVTFSNNHLIKRLFLFGSQILFGVLALLTVLALGWFHNHLTVDSPHSPTGEFIVPFEVSGGTVYVTRAEYNLTIAGWVVSGVLVGIQLLKNFIEARGKQRPTGAS